VISASASTSTVLLLQDSSAVGVEDGAGNAFVLSGAGVGNPLTLKSANASSVTIAKRTVLTTSGQTNNNPAALYPAGIPVGVVASSEVAAGGVTTGTVLPLVDDDALQFVTVLEWLPSA
jgi:cell shape-determining protein MreC